MGDSLLLLALVAATGPLDGLTGEISGTGLNGSTGDSPLAGAEVVLRASQNGAFVPVATTTTDSQGWFRFTGVPVDHGVVYLPGINRAGIHYPGPRVQLRPGQSTARAKLIAYDTIALPSPLISRRHEIAVQSGEGYLEVAETLLIENPSRTTFVGQSKDDRPPVTLRLTLPAGIEKVTFDREFHGRNFQLHDGQLITELPWPPGSRELTFIYRVPVERSYSLLTRVLDQPTDQVSVRVITKESGSVACSLPKSSSTSGPDAVFEHRGTTLPAGHQIELRLGALPLRFETYARWLAVAVLMALVAGSIVAARARRASRVVKPASAQPAEVRPTRARPGRVMASRRTTSSPRNR